MVTNMQVPLQEVYRKIHPLDDRGMSHFFTLLKQHGAGLGLSVPQMAIAVGMQSGRLYQWGNGKRKPSDNELERIAEAQELGLTLDTLKAWRALDE